MSPEYKPHGHTSVSPYLVLNGASSTIDFLVKAFDAEELLRVPNKDGKLMHSEVRIDDTVVMLADGVGTWPPVPAHVHVYVPDVDAVYQRALKAGAISVQKPQQKFDEDKRGAVRDAGGTTWWIATRVGRIEKAPRKKRQS
jgi:PhnB protein